MRSGQNAKKPALYRGTCSGFEWCRPIDNPRCNAHMRSNQEIADTGARMSQSYPVLPLRDIVVFPNMVVPLFVGRDKSVSALEAAMAADKEIFLVANLMLGSPGILK